MLGKNFEFEDINFRNVFNVHYLYLLLLLLKLIIQHNFTQFKKFFLFKYLYKYFEKDWTAANMPIFLSNIIATFYV